MDTVIAWLANYLLWVIAAAAAGYWLLGVPRPEKLRLAGAAVLGLAITLVFIAVAAHLHNDPRPFVQNPRLRPLIKHSADNGFPSDHSAAAGLIAVLVLLRSRVAGIALAVAAIVVAAARVAAHVHHVQDVAAGLLLGAVAAILATWAVGYVADRRLRATTASGPTT